MTFIEFKKILLDAEISLPKFSKLIKVSDNNLQSYKKKGRVPNTIDVIATCFAKVHQEGIDYRQTVEQLGLKKQTKSGGFKKKAETTVTNVLSPTAVDHESGTAAVKNRKKTKKAEKENAG